MLESARLADRAAKFFLLKILLLGAVVPPRGHEIATFAMWVLSSGFMKLFVGLASDRCQALVSSPVATKWQHCRCAALLAYILATNFTWMVAGLRYAWSAASINWWLLWTIDEACVAVEATHAALRYAVHAVDAWRSGHPAPGSSPEEAPSEQVEEARNSLFYLMDLSADLMLCLLSLTHHGMVLWIRGRPQLQLIDLALLVNLRFLLAGAWQRGARHLQYRRLTQRLRSGYADADAAELAATEAVCTICMDPMKARGWDPLTLCWMCPCLRSFLCFRTI